MGIDAVAEVNLRVGEATVIGATSPRGRFQAVFEDDGDTAYFYAVDNEAPEGSIQDALQIYNVASVVDRAKTSMVKIGWSSDGLKAVLLINDFPHAVFDFQARQGSCRTGFPPPPSNGTWSVGGHSWIESALGLFA